MQSFLSKNDIKLSVVRYGNVMGSRGSVIPYFIKMKDSGVLPVTDKDMTRFSITMDSALNFILETTQIAQGSEIFVPKMKAYSLGDLKNVLFDIFGKGTEETIPIRHGEKMHEILINMDEMRFTWETDKMYVIVKPELNNERIKELYPQFTKTESLSEYSSNDVERYEHDNLKELLSSGKFF